MSQKQAGKDDGTLSGGLGVTTVIVMVIAAAAPLTTVGAVAPNAFIAGNGAAYPIMYVIAALLLFLFAVGFNAMNRYVTEAGAFYSYVTLGLGRGAGVSAAYLALLTYTCVQMAVYAFMAGILQDYVIQLGGPDLPWWLWMVGIVLVVTFFGYRNIDFSGKLLLVLVALEILICLALVIAIVVEGGGPEGLSTATVTPSAWFQGAPALGLMFAVSGFLGVEGAAIYRDEVRDPERTISRATYGALLVIGFFYAVVAWGLVSAWGDSSIVEKATQDPGGLLAETFGIYLGPLSQEIVQILLLTSFFACVLSFHNVINRYTFTLGNAGLMPAILGKAHPKYHSPYIAALLQSATVLILLAVFVIMGLGPFSQIFTWMIGTSTLGFLLLMLMTCVAVLAFFKDDTRGLSPWQTRWIPLLGVIGLAVATLATVVNLPILVGTWGMSAAVIVPIVLILVGGPIFAAINPNVNADHARALRHGAK